MRDFIKRYRMGIIALAAFFIAVVGLLIYNKNKPKDVRDVEMASKLNSDNQKTLVGVLEDKTDTVYTVPFTMPTIEELASYIRQWTVDNQTEIGATGPTTLENIVKLKYSDDVYDQIVAGNIPSSTLTLNQNKLIKNQIMDYRMRKAKSELKDDKARAKMEKEYAKIYYGTPLIHINTSQLFYATVDGNVTINDIAIRRLGVISDDPSRAEDMDSYTNTYFKNIDRYQYTEADKLPQYLSIDNFHVGNFFIADTTPGAADTIKQTVDGTSPRKALYFMVVSDTKQTNKTYAAAVSKLKISLDGKKINGYQEAKLVKYLAATPYFPSLTSYLAVLPIPDDFTLADTITLNVEGGAELKLVSKTADEKESGVNIETTGGYFEFLNSTVKDIK